MGVHRRRAQAWWCAPQRAGDRGVPGTTHRWRRRTAEKPIDKFACRRIGSIAHTNSWVRPLRSSISSPMMPCSGKRSRAAPGSAARPMVDVRTGSRHADLIVGAAPALVADREHAAKAVTISAPARRASSTAVSSMSRSVCSDGRSRGSGLRLFTASSVLSRHQDVHARPPPEPWRRNCPPVSVMTLSSTRSGVPVTRWQPAGPAPRRQAPACGQAHEAIPPSHAAGPSSRRPRRGRPSPDRRRRQQELRTDALMFMISNSKDRPTGRDIEHHLHLLWLGLGQHLDNIERPCCVPLTFSIEIASTSRVAFVSEPTPTASTKVALSQVPLARRHPADACDRGTSRGKLARRSGNSSERAMCWRASGRTSESVCSGWEAS